MILVVDELNNNAIEYGSDQSENNIMRVVVQRKNNSKIDFRLEVQDTGNGCKHKTAAEMKALQDIKLGNGFDNHRSIR